MTSPLTDAMAREDAARAALDRQDEEIKQIEDVLVERARGINIEIAWGGLKGAGLAIVAAVAGGAAVAVTGPLVIVFGVTAALLGAGSGAYGAKAAYMALRWARDEEPALLEELDALKEARKPLAEAVETARRAVLKAASQLELPAGSPPPADGNA